MSRGLYSEARIPLVALADLPFDWLIINRTARIPTGLGSIPVLE